MSAIVQGELRRTKPWSVKGHEPDGLHPVLVAGRGASGDGKDILVVPTMSPDAAHENDWEVNIDGTGSCVLVDGLRAIPVTDLRTSCLGTAFPEDLRQVHFALRSLLRGTVPVSEADFVQGSVYSLLDSGDFGGANKILVLHYNYRNDMAMSIQVAPSQPGLDRLTVPILSCPALAGFALLPAYVWPIAARCRLGSPLGSISDSELGRAMDCLLDVVAPNVVAFSA